MSDAHQPRLPGLRVAVAEDSPDSAETLQGLLQLEGAVVHLAHDGARALALLREHECDLLVSDLGMPWLDGYALMAALRAEPRFAALPAIALTGRGEDADVERAFAAGFDAHVMKPVVLDELVAQIARVLPPPAPAA